MTHLTQSKSPNLFFLSFELSKFLEKFEVLDYKV